VALEKSRRWRDGALVFYKGCQVKKALITGITGQDGAYLAELLLGWFSMPTIDNRIF
jgi:hypothetical protein